jgi:hypothetical protein
MQMTIDELFELVHLLVVDPAAGDTEPDDDEPKLYRLTVHAYVEANSESAARQCWIDGDYAGLTLRAVDRQPDPDATPPHGIEITPELRAAMKGNTL